MSSSLSEVFGLVASTAVVCGLRSLTDTVETISLLLTDVVVAVSLLSIVVRTEALLVLESKLESLAAVVGMEDLLVVGSGLSLLAVVAEFDTFFS